MFPPDDVPSGSAHELLQRCTAELAEALELIGVYVNDRHVVARQTPEGPEAALFVTGVIGRVAFGDRVQRPDQEAVDALFEGMTDNLVETEFEERRRALDD